MGLLYYGADTTPSEIPDRLLAHVKVVVATKLRRNESFTISWRHPEGDTLGRTTLWIQPSIPLRFVFDNAEPETIEPTLLRELANAAQSSAGMMLTWDAEQATRAAEPAQVDQRSAEERHAIGPVTAVAPVEAAPIEPQLLAA